MAWRGRWSAMVGGLALAVMAGCSGDRVPMFYGLDSGDDDGSLLTEGPSSVATTLGPMLPGDDGMDTTTGGGGPLESTTFGGFDSSGGLEETGFGMDDDMPLVTTIRNIKNGLVAPGTLVQINQAVATTPWADLPSDLGGELYLQDPDGGFRSGIYVQILGPAPFGVLEGDLVGVVAMLRVQAGVRYLTGLSEDVSYTAMISPPEPLPVDVDLLIPFNPAVPDHEGVLVRLDDVQVTDLTESGAPILEDKLRIDDRFFGGDLPSVTIGETFTSVSGPLILDADGLAIGPRDGADLVP